MAEFCDTTRSPCEQLIDELGRSILVDKKTGRFFTKGWSKDTSYISQFKAGKSLIRWIEIKYCPFCGCRLEIIEV